MVHALFLEDDLEEVFLILLENPILLCLRAVDLSDLVHILQMNLALRRHVLQRGG